MPAPVIAAIITSGAVLGGAEVARRSANKSARTQSDALRDSSNIQDEATAKAIAAQREQEGYERQRLAAQEAARGPYVNAGNQSLAALAKELNLPAFDAKAMPPMIQPTGDFQPPSLDGYQTRAGAMPMQGAPSRQLLDRPSSLASYGPQGQGGQGEMVTLVAPTGETKAVPRDQVARLLARGARYA